MAKTGAEDKMAFEQRYQEWAAQKWPDEGERRRNAWLLDALRTRMSWGQGREVGSGEFDEAIAAVQNIQLGGGPPPAKAPEHE
jgi:hypothetical protein